MAIWPVALAMFKIGRKQDLLKQMLRILSLTVLFVMMSCIRTIKSEVVKTTSLFIDIDIFAKPTQLIAHHN